MNLIFLFAALLTVCTVRGFSLSRVQSSSVTKVSFWTAGVKCRTNNIHCTYPLSHLDCVHSFIYKQIEHKQ